MAAYTHREIDDFLAGRFDINDFILCPTMGCTTMLNPQNVFANITGTTAFGGQFFLLSNCDQCVETIAIQVTRWVREEEARFLREDSLTGRVFPDINPPNLPEN